MKTDFLKAFGLTEEQIAEVMKENGKDVEGVKSKFADYDTLKTQLAETGKTIEGFKAMDIEGIKKAAEDWKTKAEKSEQDAAAKIAEMQFNNLLDGSITAAKGKNNKAIRALLDLDSIGQSKNQTEDITKALETLQKESGYLFETDGASAPHVVGRTSGTPATVTKEAFNKMSYKDRVEMKNTNPGLYESMKE